MQILQIEGTQASEPRIARSILFITGTRADFSKLEPLAQAARDAGFTVRFFVTGMHMLKQHGLTRHEVHRFNNCEIHESLNQRTNDAQDVILAKTVSQFSDYAAAYPPDLVVLHGDRIETLACAIVCATNYIRTAHIEGGEVSGSIDESLRHCTSKLATFHFVSCEQARHRIRALGENPGHIHVIGSPELDVYARPASTSLAEVKSAHGIPFESYGIVLFHAVTSEAAGIGAQATDLFQALCASRREFIVIGANNDPGSAVISQIHERLPRARFHPVASLPFAHFAVLMQNAACLIGNSSAGVREAPFLGLPSLDVGTRQKGRAVAESIRWADAADHLQIAAFLETEWGKRYPSTPLFGTGNAARAFVEILKDEAFWAGPLQKTFHDL